MGKRLYMAYGSNLSVEQMRFRCPDARVIGKAYLKDWKLVFRFHADIEPCKGYRVPVLIWEISTQDEKRLDRYEGYPLYYIKKDLNAVMQDTGKSVKAMVYVMATMKRQEPPASHYYHVIEGGYKAFGFDINVLEKAASEAFK